MSDLSVVQDNQVAGAGPGSNPRPYLCVNCGRRFFTVHHLDAHQARSCAPSKRGLSALLKETKDFWESRKKRRPEGQEQPEPSLPHSRPDVRTATTPGGNPLPEPLSGSPIAPSAVENTPSLTDAPDLDVAIAQRKGKRERRLPLRYRQDTLPDSPLPVVDAASSTESPSLTEPIPGNQQGDRPLVLFVSTRNKFHVQRVFTLPSPPTHDPRRTLARKDPSAVSAFVSPSAGSQRFIGPFPNRSAFELAQWYWTSTSKSFLDFRKLIEIFKRPDFSLNEAIDVNWKSTFNALGSNASDLPGDAGAWIKDAGWTTTPITIDVPFHNRLKDPGIKQHQICQFHHRNILSVITEKLTNPTDSIHFHYYPFKSTWQRTAVSPEIELYGEIYASRAFRDAHEELQKKPSTPKNDGLERVVVALMIWSDATQLTSFGPAALWPGYLFFGNESKDRRCRPSERLGHQIAYFNKLPDAFADYLKARNEGKLPTDALFSHCARELFHKQWSVLLDLQLVDAMRDGIVVICPDGQSRCFYPRIFTYSADYPEKALVCGVRNNGSRPCHRCLVSKPDIAKLGAPTDTERFEEPRSASGMQLAVVQAREHIEAGYAVDGAKIEGILKPESLVPIQCAFSTLLTDVAFDITNALVVDILHEFEVGVWKRLYTHLMRLLEAFTDRQSITLTAELDSRYRLIPSFGRDSIRKFGTNASEMKRRAARDFEDLLQCAIPVFDSLLPEPHNGIVMKLLFICAQWHALAKLRLHHDLTLQLLEQSTTLLGAQMRLFYRDTCCNVATKELAREAQARARREVTETSSGVSSTRKPVTLNIFTIKFHYLGDYPGIIRRFGTTDSYSTETGELYHRDPKSWYLRTDRKEYQAQLSRIERRQARLSQLRLELDQQDSQQTVQPPGGSAEVQASHDRRYAIGASQNLPVELGYFNDDLGMRTMQPYFKDFNFKLKQYLFRRVLDNIGLKTDIVDELMSGGSWVHVVLEHGRIYSHKLLRMNYTTYDIRREQDVIHIDTPQCNIMMLNRRFTKETRHLQHPYLYGRVLGIFHANVTFVGPLPASPATRDHATGFNRMDFIWVHWYNYLGSDDCFSLDRVAPCELTSPMALDFADPQDVLRGIHFIPQFSLGQSSIPAPRFRFSRKAHDVWKAYYINKFADRDLFMRYQYGMSVGHTYMQTEAFPEPTIPSLPLGFDHCLDVGPGSLEEGNALSTGEDTREEELDAPDERTGVLGPSSDHFEDMDDRELMAYEEMYHLSQLS